MSGWIVEMTIKGEISEDNVMDVMEVLAPHGPAVSFLLDRFTVEFEVDAGDSNKAVWNATEVIDRVLHKIGLPHYPIVRLVAMTSEEKDLEVARPTYPAVLGIAELADRLGVSKQRASQIARSSKFPKPYAELAAGPVWLEPNVLRFIEEWDRQPGRPRKPISA